MTRRIAWLALATCGLLTACNNAPVGAGAGLLPEAPTTLDDLELQLTQATDDDRNDSVSHEIAWFVNGMEQVDLAGQDVVTADLTSKGEEWTVQVTPTDGDLAGETASASVTILNTPPSVTVAIEPDSPNRGAPLMASAETTDVDGETPTLVWSWTVDGDATTYATPTIPADVTVAGETWQVTVAPSDSDVQGASASASVTILNTPPEISTVSLNPTTAYEDTVLEVVIDATDHDDDDLTFLYTWTVNGADAGVPPNQSTLDGASFDKGDQVRVAVVADDGNDKSVAVVSDPVVIQNSVPSAPTVGVTPAEPDPDDDLVCEIQSDAQDVDDDFVTYVFVWTLDGSAWAGPTATTNYSGDTIAASHTDVGDSWACLAVGIDGTDSGPAGTSDAVDVLANLLVDGTEQTLAEGAYSYRTVSVTNGGWLTLEGLVEIEASTFTVDAYSLVEGVGQGSAADSGSGAGGTSTNAACGGGGYGGAGGTGGYDSGDTVGTAGSSYGSSSADSISAGSGGGSCGSTGGAGGAGLYLYAETITVAGYLWVDGQDSGASSRGGGGGSGGGVLLWGDTVSISGEISATGGDADDGDGQYNDGGGGGGGGRIKVFYDSSYSLSGTLDVSGGHGGDTGTAAYGVDGTDGSTYDAYVAWPGL
jgi:hypothetical protein